jgi:methyl-accepting chemotaxis protein
MKLASISVGIATRLYAVVALITLSLVGISVFAFVELGVIVRDADRIGEERVPQMQRAAAIEIDVTRVSLQIRHAMLARNPTELSATLSSVATLRQRVETTLAEYTKAAQTEEGRQRAAAIARVAGAFWEVGQRNLALVQQGQRAEAFAFLVDQTIPVRNQLLEEVAQAVTFYRTRLDTDVQEIEAEALLVRNWLAGLALAVALLLVVFAWHVAAVLRTRVALTQAAAERVRDGDFTEPVRDDARDEFSPLLQAMQAMQDALTRVVGTVRERAESVATASAQIAQGNSDLSSRTEQQASALEETAASMEELGSTVKQNADNARQADQLAQGASAVAIRGGEVVGQVVDTMKGINDSSKKIADIIGTIDGIAFQTNILALNAAVEAARAGEQGRGFAVVAAEVRNLAQRSAEAAKEIKALITASVQRVEHGTALADQAGSTMQEVVSSIRRVTDIMGEISSASVEQSQGVAQVGEAVSQMDQVTQQNAALVEESAAAAESLKVQAQQLVATVAVFRVSNKRGESVSRAASDAESAATVPYAGSERRGPGRASNVARPGFAKRKAAIPAAATAQATAQPPAAVPVPAAASRTGTDDWESF